MKTVQPATRNPSWLISNGAAMTIILLTLSLLVGLVTRDIRWRNWLRDNGCRARPMQDPATTVGRAAGERCYECEGRVTVCR